MSAKFRCKLSGNIFEFFNEFDILDMREHEQYEEVKEEAVVEKKTIVSPKKTRKTKEQQ